MAFKEWLIQNGWMNRDGTPTAQHLHEYNDDGTPARNPLGTHPEEEPLRFLQEAGDHGIRVGKNGRITGTSAIGLIGDITLRDGQPVLRVGFAGGFNHYPIESQSVKRAVTKLLTTPKKRA
ncbi:hypothetical protein HY345_01545 [Candidatus Microgenomates bacterium]|nr:hypothetical protein [Candidatus Microgenomates bacterium]